MIWLFDVKLLQEQWNELFRFLFVMVLALVWGVVCWFFGVPGWLGYPIAAYLAFRFGRDVERNDNL